MIHFISDTHFGHANIIKYSKRPFSSVEEMNRKLIENWNARVAPDDIVWHLGDFAFMKPDQFMRLLERLNGRKHVVLGNHDKVIVHNKHELLNSKLLASIQNYAELKIDGQMIVLFHYGQRVWNRSHHSSIHLYGHSHGSLPPHGKSVDIGVDSKEITDEYRPVSLDEVFAYIAKRDKTVVDHHGMRDEEGTDEEGRNS